METTANTITGRWDPVTRSFVPDRPIVEAAPEKPSRKKKKASQHDIIKDGVLVRKINKKSDYLIDMLSTNSENNK